MVRTLRRVIPFVLFLGFLALLWPIQLGGQTAYVIVDGTSMEPTYDDGDLVVARARSSYAEGEVVAFAVPADDLPAPYRVIHRIAERDADGTFVTIGDNRDQRDPWPLTDDDVIGAAWFHLPGVGEWVVRINERPLLLAWLAAVLTFVFLMPSARDRDDEAATTDPRADEPQVPDAAPPAGRDHGPLDTFTASERR